MLAVVQIQAMVAHASRPPAELRRGLEQRDRHLLLGQGDRGRKTGPTAADDGNRQLNTQVRQASHSLRNGVSETRCCRTG